MFSLNTKTKNRHLYCQLPTVNDPEMNAFLIKNAKNAGRKQSQKEQKSKR